jgi:CubicO group peptidase (beta-lactamase class C family)
MVSPEATGIEPAALDALLVRAAREVEEGHLPSAQIALARHGRLLAFRTFGTVRHEGVAAPATNETRYCVFSCTKAITSAIAWLLVQEGQLRIDERVAGVVPEFAANGKDAVLVEHLFTHTAGFPHAPFDPLEFPDVARRRARFAQWKLRWEPGTRFEYHPSSSMYVVADILERRTGATYAELVRTRIAEPLGLESLHCGLPRALHGTLADIVHVGAALTDADYAKMGVPPPPVTEVTEEALQHFNEPAVRESGIPGGGATMTAADLAMFYQALLTGRAPDGTVVWRPETLEMARTIRSGTLTDPVFGKLANRGLGIIIAGGDDRNYRGFGHTNSPLAFGHNGAGGQIAWADPATGLSLGYCTNGHDRNAFRQARRGIGISSRAAAVAVERES